MNLQLSRIHSADLAYERVLAAKEHGYVMCRLILCAIPEQTEALGASSRFISSGVNHVSVYPLTIEDGIGAG